MLIFFVLALCGQHDNEIVSIQVEKLSISGEFEPVFLPKKNNTNSTLDDAIKKKIKQKMSEITNLETRVFLIRNKNKEFPFKIWASQFEKGIYVWGSTCIFKYDGIKITAIQGVLFNKKKDIKYGKCLFSRSEAKEAIVKKISSLVDKKTAPADIKIETIWYQENLAQQELQKYYMTSMEEEDEGEPYLVSCQGGVVFNDHE